MPTGRIVDVVINPACCDSYRSRIWLLSPGHILRQRRLKQREQVKTIVQIAVRHANPFSLLGVENHQLSTSLLQQSFHPKESRRQMTDKFQSLHQQFVSASFQLSLRTSNKVSNKPLAEKLQPRVELFINGKFGVVGI